MKYLAKESFQPHLAVPSIFTYGSVPFTGTLAMFCTGLLNPVASCKSAKFSSAGGCTAVSLRGLNVPAHVRSDVAGFANMGLAKNTWANYRTAERLFLKCQRLHKTRFELPVSLDSVVLFVHYLVTARRLKGATISGYLAGIRQLHLQRGLDPPPALASQFIKQLLRGISNADGLAARAQDGPTGRHGRLPITPAVLTLLKKLASKAPWPIEKKLLFWAVANLAFAGAFRVHELLARASTDFDPRFTLLAEDVLLSGGPASEPAALHIRLKSPKEAKCANPVLVDVLRNNGPLCPVRAFTKWAAYRQPPPSLPVFSRLDGSLFTGRELNQCLKQLLGPYVDPSAGSFSSHSFRIGLATTLGSLGCSDMDVKAAGRWSSRAFELYMRLPRGKRSEASRLIQGLT